MAVPFPLQPDVPSDPVDADNRLLSQLVAVAVAQGGRSDDEAATPAVDDAVGSAAGDVAD